MRNLGGILLLAGVVGFFYSSDRVSQAPPLNESATITETLREERGRWEAARFLSVAAAGIGLLLATFPKGR